MRAKVRNVSAAVIIAKTRLGDAMALNTETRAFTTRVGKYMLVKIRDPRTHTHPHTHAQMATFLALAHQLPSTWTPNAALHVCHANTALEKTSSAAKDRSLASAMYLG